MMQHKKSAQAPFGGDLVTAIRRHTWFSKPLIVGWCLCCNIGAWAISFEPQPCARQLVSFEKYLEEDLKRIWQGPYVHQLREIPDPLLKNFSHVYQGRLINLLQGEGSLLADLRWNAFLSKEGANYRQNSEFRVDVRRLRRYLTFLTKLFTYVRPNKADYYTIFNGIKIYRESQLSSWTPNLWAAYKKYASDLNDLILRPQDREELDDITSKIKESENLLTLGQNSNVFFQRWNDYARGNRELLEIGNLYLNNQLTFQLATLFKRAKAQLVVNLVINEITPYGPRYMVEIVVRNNHRIPTWLKDVLADWFTQPDTPNLNSLSQRRQLVVPQQF